MVRIIGNIVLVGIWPVPYKKMLKMIENPKGWKVILGLYCV